MEATVIGANKTGAAASSKATREMVEASEALTPPQSIDLTMSKAERIRYIEEADSVGSIPPPVTLKGVVTTGIAKMKGANPSILLDKMGERLAYERSGTRLYDALITKYEGLSQVDGESVTAALRMDRKNGDGGEDAVFDGGSALETLQRIRSEELEHFKMLSMSIEALGGDPTAQTPCADVSGTASMGFMQVLTDPRTTLAQCLNTMLSVELTDNAGWELLIQLADDAGETEIAGQFLAALGQEQQHLTIIRSWLEGLISKGAGTQAV